MLSRTNCWRVAVRMLPVLARRLAEAES